LILQENEVIIKGTIPLYSLILQEIADKCSYIPKNVDIVVEIAVTNSKKPRHCS